MLKIAYSPVYSYTLPEKHRFPMIKYELLPEQLLYEGTITEEQFFHPSQLTRQQLLLTHSAEYLDKLDSLTLSKREIRDIGFPIRKDLIERGKYISMGTFQCAEYAAQYGISMNVAGGTHHAFRDHGEGFCVFNDFAIACNLLIEKGIYNRILIVDLDVHQGNGTASIFKDNPKVFTMSVHGEKNYPLRKAKSDLDIGLPDKTGDDLYLKTIEDNLPKLIESFEPEFIFYLAGVDILETDKLGRLSVSMRGCTQRDEYVFKLCKSNAIPIAVSMGGGYSPKLTDIIEAHANTFRAAMDIYF